MFFVLFVFVAKLIVDLEWFIGLRSVRLRRFVAVFIATLFVDLDLFITLLSFGPVRFVVVVVGKIMP